MISLLGILSVLNIVFCDISFTHENMPGAQYYDGKKLNIPITDEAAIELFERWMTQALSSVMSAVAYDRSQHLNEYHRNRLFKCSNGAADIYEHARCVTAAFDAPVHKTKQQFQRDERLRKIRRRQDEERKNVLFQMRQLTAQNSANYKATKKRRMKRKAIRRSSYRLHSENDNMTPFGIIGKYLGKALKIVKQKKPTRSWETLLADLERKQKKIVERKRFLETFKKMSSMTESSKKPSKVEEQLKRALVLPDVVERAEDNDGKKRQEEAARLIESAVKLAMTLSGSNRTDLMNKTLKIASPRLFSIVPNDVEDELDVLSPSLFSLHNKGKGIEALTSLPNLIKEVKNKDFDEWLEFIIEASGVTDAIGPAVENDAFYDFDIRNAPRGIDNQPLYFTKENVSEIAGVEETRKIELFEALAKSLNKKQLADFHHDGYSVMNAEQLKLIYGEHSPYNDTSSLTRFLAMNETEVRKRLLSDIRDLATKHAKQPSRSTRVKRQGIAVLSPTILTIFLFQFSPTTVLSPILLSASIFSPDILGPVILSPWLFHPLILSPRVIVPIVLSPFAFSPLVLSPVVMTPVILSPQLLLPIIVSPNVLSPYILSPTVMVPSILSPFALSPSIYSPSSLTALILSPFILSPAIYSPFYIGLHLLSPKSFSPNIKSLGKAGMLILSPSSFS